MKVDVPIAECLNLFILQNVNWKVLFHFLSFVTAIYVNMNVKEGNVIFYYHYLFFFFTIYILVFLITCLFVSKVVRNKVYKRIYLKTLVFVFFGTVYDRTLGNNNFDEKLLEENLEIILLIHVLKGEFT